MNKFAEKIHYQFIKGKISSPVFNYMMKIAGNVGENEITLFDRHIKQLNKLGAETEQDCEIYFKVFSKFNSMPLLNEKLCVYAFTNRSKYDFNKSHNFQRCMLDFARDNMELVKQSYPNNMGMEGSEEVKPPYNLDKWVETMRYIYDAADTNNLPLDVVAKKVLANWNEKEAEDFGYWMRYYTEGNYGKYNVKTAQFYMPQQKTEEKPAPTATDLFAKPDPKVEKAKRLDDARKKLRGRLKSVLELLDIYRDVLTRQDNDAMRKDIYGLNERVWNLELKASLVDTIIRTSNQFNKRGFIEGANELKKIAQEVATDKLPDAIEPPAVEVGDVETPPLVEDAEEDMKGRGGLNIPPVDATRSHINAPNFNEISYKEAIRTLEEINSIVSERAVVRALAGVDIMLAELGIASYFVELAEAQSKLLDSFNYSATRISNVISQLRGRSIAEAKEIGKKEKQQEQAKKQKREQEEQKKDVVETEEELNKPVGEVANTAPPTQTPVVKPQV